MKNIEVLDRSFKRLAFIDKDVEEGLHFNDDSLSTSIESGVYTLEMNISKDTPLIRHITSGNYITFINRNDVRVLTTIMKVNDNRDSISIYCEDTSINLINKVVDKIDMPKQPENVDYYINAGLEGTGWSIGTNESEKTRQIEFDGTEVLLQRIRNIAEEFEVEFYFEVDIETGKSPDFKIHIVENRIEGNKGFRVSSEDALEMTDREVNLDSIVTKLVVKGATIEAEKDDDGSSAVIIAGDDKKVGQPSADKFDSSKQSSAGAISTTNWNQSWVDQFDMNAADPHYVTGAYIDDFLRARYPDSTLIGHGSTIKEMSDYFGVSVGAAIGVWAKETTLGRNSCGGKYNFGCIMWTEGSPFSKAWASDRYWINPPTVKSGIAAWFKLLRYGYIETGQVKYKDFLNKYSPVTDGNNQATFKNIMWGALKAFGYDTSSTITKKNYSNKNDNPLTLDLSGKTSNNNSNGTVTTKHNEMIEKMIKWFSDRLGKVSYSMASRGGPNSYDCSSAVYAALFYADFKTKITYYGSTVSLWNDVGSNNLMVEIPRNQAQRGDIFLSGGKGAASAGASGHTGVFLSNNEIIHCNFRDNGISRTPVEGRAGSPIYCFRLVNKTSDISQSNHIDSTSITTKTEQAVQYCLQQVGKPYVYGGVGPNSFDCSGLIYWAYRKAGFTINHRATTYTIANQQSPFKKISASEARRGDLVICVGGSHVAILLDTPTSGKGVAHAATPQLGVITQTGLMGPIGYYRVM